MTRFKAFIPLALAVVLSCIYMAYGITQEPPVGVVEGTVSMQESGKPLAQAMIYLQPQPYNDAVPGRSVITDSAGHFRMKAVAVGSYLVTASTTAHTLKPLRIQVDDGKRVSLALSLAPNAPFLDVQASQHVFTAKDTPGIHIHGFVKQSEITVTVTRLDVNRIAEAGGLNATFEPLNGKERQQGPDHFGGLVRTISKSVKKDVEGVFYQRMAMPELGEGIYWVECTAGPLHSGTYFNITHVALISEYAGTTLLAYTVDILSGKPLAGVPIFTGSPNGLQPVGVSDASGLIDVTLTANQKSVIVAKVGNALAVCERQMEDMRERRGPDTVFLYTDRSIYRPGDAIQFKGIVRERSLIALTPHGVQDVDYSLPKPEPVTATLSDARGNKLATVKLPMGPHGTFHGMFTTSKEVAPGDFTIDASSDAGQGSLDVPVAEYRKPDYTITVLADKPYYILGDTAQATVSCQYYYGGPVVGAKVQVSVFRSEDWQGEYGGDDSGDSSPGSQSGDFVGGDYEQEISAVTDATGRAVISFPTRGNNDPSEVSSDYIYTMQASVADEGDKYFTGSGAVSVVRGNLRLTLDSDRDVAAPGDTVQLTAKVTSQPNAGEAVAGRAVEVVVGTEEWTGTSEVFHALNTIKAMTDGTGIAQLSVPVGDVGSLALRGMTMDSAGHRIRSEADVYVSGDHEFQTFGPFTITATLDRKKYAVGDTAKLLVQTSKPGGSALVTVEADSIISRMVVPLTQKATLVTLPVNVAMTPNAYIAVAYIRAKTYMEASKDLVVSRVDRDLKVVVTPDRPTAKPGETVTFDVATFDPKGHPVSTDASLGVVDEAIYAIRKDTTDIRSGFYPRRNNEVMTSYSFPEIYLDGGDKGSGKVPIRSRFLDTAAWTPNIQTGADGHGKVRVTLPDNLTRWRATAVACTDDGLVGMSANDVTARKDLMVTINSPSYLVSGDRQQAAITVTNDTGHDADVALSLTASGIQVDSPPPASIHVTARKPETVRVSLIAAETGTAELTAVARLADGEGDAVKMPVRIAPHGMSDVVSRSGDTDATASLTFTRQADVDVRSGGLRLTLSPSVAAGLLKPMGALVDFPYGCVEQTMSRFLPSVLVTKAFRQAGLPLPKLSAQLPEITSDSFTRLARLQHVDGGWGWWEYDESSPFMTALVLDGLKRGSDAGYPTPKSIALRKALDWAEKWLRIDPKLRDDRHDTLYLAYVLARYGRTVAAKKALAENQIGKLAGSELAYAALTAGTLGQKPDAYLARLRQTASFHSAGVSWKGNNAFEWGEESTAVVLVAFATLAPNDPLVPTIVRGLMARRRDDEWYSTRDTAYVLTGISKYLEHSHEAASSEKVDIVVNGKVVRTVALDPKRAEDSDVTVDLPIEVLPVGTLTVQLRRHGASGGRVYYCGVLTQMVTAPSFEASSSDPGFTVSRKFYVLEPKQLSDGSLKLLPSSTPVNRVPSGSIVQCVVTIASSRPRNFIQVECPTPSNCHVTEREDPLEGEDWAWWWCSTVIRDDKIAFFARTLPAGVKNIRYTMRAESPGDGSALPIVAVNMYDPTERASSADADLEVVR
ncbi:MAG: MG2 domain-containing protein [Fimbriimonadaceae bacterium]